MSNSSFFYCPACAKANPTQFGQRPDKCIQCGMNFAYAKYSSAPAAPQVIYRDAPVVKTKKQYKYVEELEEDEEYFDFDPSELKGVIRIESERAARPVTIESALANPAQKVDLGIPNGPAKSIEQIKSELAASNARDWNVGDGVELRD